MKKKWISLIMLFVGSFLYYSSVDDVGFKEVCVTLLIAFSGVFMGLHIADDSKKTKERNPYE